MDQRWRIRLRQTKDWAPSRGHRMKCRLTLLNMFNKTSGHAHSRYSTGQVLVFTGLCEIPLAGARGSLALIHSVSMILLHNIKLGHLQFLIHDLGTTTI